MKKYLVIIDDYTMYYHNTKEEAEQRVAQLLLAKSPRTTNGAGLYQLQKTGVRHLEPSVQWIEDTPSKRQKTTGRHYAPWTTDENDFLVEARRAGLSYREIAKTLTRTVRAIEVQASRLRLQCG